MSILLILMDNMLSSQNNIALEFAKKCIGWEDAAYQKGTRHNHSCISFLEEYDRRFRNFNHGDIRCVLKYAKIYCDQNDFSLAINYHSREKIWEARCFDSSYTSENKNLGIAIMEVCIKASQQAQS